MQNYCDTPHPATNFTSSAMLFCDRQSFRFDRHTISKKQVNEAQKTSYFQKQHRKQEINAAEYTKREKIKIKTLC